MELLLLIILFGREKLQTQNISDDQTNSIREFNSFVKDFKGTESMILSIADGMTICRKL